MFVDRPFNVVLSRECYRKLKRTEVKERERTLETDYLFTASRISITNYEIYTWRNSSGTFAVN